MHSIRLRHPWECEVQGDATEWSRVFNWPAELQPGEVVWLVIEPLPEDAQVELNGTALEFDSSTNRVDITALVTQTNRLVIMLSDLADAEATECPLDVRLEIEEA